MTPSPTRTALRDAAVTVAPLQPAETGAWDAYVRAHADGLPLHQAGWQLVLRRTYGYQTHYLLARRGADVVGVLPLFIVRSRLLGTRAATPPGGLCADDAEVAAHLIDAGRAVARAHGAAHLALHDTRRVWDGHGAASTTHVHWVVDVAPDSDALWSRLDGNMRRQVRKARRNGLTVELDRTGRLLDPFYAVLSRFTHESGTPVFPRAFLQNVVDVFPGGFNIVVVYADGAPVAGYFQLVLGRTVYGMWGAGLRHALPLRPTYLGIWEALRDSADSGHATLDMGRSPAGSSTSDFKGQWGGTARPVYQQIIAADGSTVDSRPVTTKVQSDRSLQLVQRVWPRLPLAVTRRIGPLLRRHIPFG